MGRALRSDSEEIENHLRGSRAFAWVARKVDAAASARVHALNLKGIYFQKESKRFYPKGELAAQVLGYVGLDDEGLGGVERQFESKLAGKPGRMLISMDACAPPPWATCAKQRAPMACMASARSRRPGIARSS